MQKFRVNGQSVPKIELKQTDGGDQKVDSYVIHDDDCRMYVLLTLMLLLQYSLMVTV